jgi:hypothetical protein
MDKDAQPAVKTYIISISKGYTRYAIITHPHSRSTIWISTNFHHRMKTVYALYRVGN